MLRVLQVYPQMNNAGTERVIMNLYENMDLEKVQFDFLVEKQGELDEKIKNMGGRIYYLPSDCDYRKKLKQFLKEHSEYHILHTHTHGNMGIVLKIAKKCGIKCRIAHSHNARTDLPVIATFLKGLTSLEIEKNATHFFACSTNAAKWLFPHRTKECKVVYNGIDLRKYLYQEDRRNYFRHELGIKKNETVLIHVGRFAKQKNHEFLIKVFDYLIKKEQLEAKLLLIGVGPLQEEIKRLVESLGLKERVIFMGNRSDVDSLLSASDLFVFPSLHEGLGIVVIEAQASGLKCIVSDAVPDEADLKLRTLQKVSLQDSEKYWCEMIREALKEKCNRNAYNERIMNSNYNIKNVAKQMQEFYIANS